MKPNFFFTLLCLVCAALLGACATQPGQGKVMRALEKAERAYDTESWRQAEEAYRELTGMIPQDAYAYFRLGNTLAKQARLDEAAVMYREALARDAGLARAYSNLAMVYLLLSESALGAAIDKAQKNDATTVIARKMQKEVRKITNIPVQEIEPPMGARGSRALNKN